MLEIHFIGNVLEIFFLKFVEIQGSNRTVNVLKVQHLKRHVYDICCDRPIPNKSTLTSLEVCFKKAKKSSVSPWRGRAFSIKYSNEHFQIIKLSTKKMKLVRDNRYVMKLTYKYEKRFEEFISRTNSLRIQNLLFPLIEALAL